MPSLAHKQPEVINNEAFSVLDGASVTVGQVLRSGREARKETLDHISKSLRISESYLKALESDDREHMPELVYTIGFLRTYSLYLGLDPVGMIAKFKKQFAQINEVESITFPMPPAERTIPGKTLVVLATLLAFLVAGVWLYLRPGTEAIDEFKHMTPIVSAAEEVVEPQAEEQPAPAEIITEEKEFTQPYPTFPVPDARPYEETRALKVQVEGNLIHLGQAEAFTIQAKEDSWIDLRTCKGEVLYNKTMKAGESQEFKAQAGLVFSTGNAGGVTFFVDGKYYSGLGKDAEVMKGKTLTFEGQ